MTGAFEGFALPAGVDLDDLTTFGAGEVGTLGADDGAAIAEDDAATFWADDGAAIVAPRVTPEWIASVVRRLGTTTAALRKRPARAIVEALGRTGERFMDDGDDLRREALDLLPASARLSSEMARVVLDGMAADWTGPRLSRWLEAELADPRCLDGFIDVRGRRLMAVGPALCTQIVSGSVPGVGVNALLRSLAAKAPTLLKPGLGDVVLPVLFARGLRQADPELADSVAVVYWPGGAVDVERAALSRAETVVVYGSDETVTALRALTPPTARLVAYRHRVGVAVVGREALTGADAPRAAGEVARAVSIFEQRGCVCPHLVLAEEGGGVAPPTFARLVADALGELAERLPAAPLPMEEASAVQQLRASAEMWAAAGDGEPRPAGESRTAGYAESGAEGNAESGAVGDAESGTADDVAVWHGGGGASWTVVYGGRAGRGSGAGGGRFVEAIHVGRTVHVGAIADASHLVEAVAPIAAHLQTVGVTGLGERAGAVGEALGRAGASRLAPLHAVSFPPPWWMHDGRGGLQDLVRWVELEGE